MNRARALFALAVVLTIAATIVGWRTFFFLTDDAHIEFRYAYNSLRGLGLTWNPAPFRPVEGYTSLAWTLLLRFVWQLTSIEPPVAAPLLSLLFGLGTLALAYAIFRRVRLPAAAEPYRPALFLVALVGVLLNRTFLAWLSSGLETAMFNFVFTWWLYEAVRASEDENPSTLLRWSFAAAAIELTRPDGVLAVMATAATLGWLLLRRRMRARDAALSFLPLLATPVHFLWRHQVYGAWQPNTYYAKYVRPWPESGARYFGSFVLEYSLWFWALLAVAAIVAFARRRELPALRLPFLAAVSVFVAHFGYYTLIIGGDHFEFRVYSQLIPLVFLSGAWFSAHAFSPRRALGALAAFVLLSLPIPWTHWARTRELYGEDQTVMMRVAIADAFPAPVRPVAALWDSWQSWLIGHLVCVRHQEHRAFYEHYARMLPPRARGSALPWSARNVAAPASIGVVGWVFPDVAVIDVLGLTDAVVARQPGRPNEERLMAHDRSPPRGYLDCFGVNVVPVKKPDGWIIVVAPRTFPLTDERIRECESRPWR